MVNDTVGQSGNYGETQPNQDTWGRQEHTTQPKIEPAMPWRAVSQTLTTPQETTDDDPTAAESNYLDPNKGKPLRADGSGKIDLEGPGIYQDDDQRYDDSGDAFDHEQRLRRQEQGEYVTPSE